MGRLGITCMFSLLTVLANAQELTSEPEASEVVTSRGMEIEFPPEWVGYDIGDVTLSQKYLGSSSGNFTGEVVLFGEKEIAKYCAPNHVETKAERLERFGNKTVVVDFQGSTQNYQACFGGSTLSLDLDYIGDWCELGGPLIFVEDRVAGLFYFDHDGSYNAELFDKFPFLQDCLIHEVAYSEKYAKFRDFLREVEDQQNHNSFTIDNITFYNVSVIATMQALPGSCVEIFESFLVQIFFRGVLGSMYLGTGLLSMMYLFSNSYRHRRNQFINNLILCTSFISTFLIGLVLINGGWRLTENVSYSVNNFMLPLFFGSGVASDWLLACRWHEIKHERVLANKGTVESRLFEQLKRRIVVWFAILLIIGDWAYSIAFVAMTKETEVIVKTYVPTFYMMLQMIVIFHLAYQVHGMLALLRGLQDYLRRHSSMTLQQVSAYNAQGLMITKLRFWIIISVVSALVSVVTLLIIGLTNSLEGSCSGWTYIWCLALTSKLANTIANIKVVGGSGNEQNKNKVQGADDSEL